MKRSNTSRNTVSDRAWQTGFRIFLTGLLLLGLAACSVPPPPSSVQEAWRSSEALLLDRHGQPLQQTRVDKQARRLAWVPLQQLPAELSSSVLAAEDRRFHEHGGVDWLALFGAARDTAGGDTRGASTITMQLAGLLDDSLSPADGRRSLWQKIMQMRVAGHLEADWNKPEILEAYLNLAPFRGELVGIDAVSRVLLGKAPSELDQRDSLILASLLRAPNARPERVAQRACALALSLPRPPACPALRAYTLAVLNAPQQPLPGPADSPELLPQLQPHAGQQLRTTLDARLQRQVRAQLREQLAQLYGRNVRDAAAVVLDNASGEVLAWVGTPGAGGSARFVDGVLAPRQAGSTLKPFLYGLAMERQLITPATLLDDSPVALATPAGQYVPQNYDRSFRGPVSVRTSLASSLNIPAVRTLLLVGLDDFHDRLRQLGLQLDRPAAHYGYGLALGSAEVRLIDLANAYRSLANGGQLSPWRLVATAPVPGKQVSDRATSWLVGDILADRSARATAFGFDNALATPVWAAVKTGTSKDMRDNWAVGYTARHTVAVWVGNADGEAMWDVSGVSGAAPAWRAIIALLGQPGEPPGPPAGLEQRTLRYLPAVEAPRQEYFLAGTATDTVELTGNQPGPAIVYPAEGLIVALDPDIPAARQRIWLRASNAEGLHWLLNGQRLGRADADLAWSPSPGKHQLALQDAQGRVKRQVIFQVRGQYGR
ncbi:MAG: penicillin-binding protein 1C [Chitinimonas sp.]|nr:penicillin-binding protein 1C [Chitinimonas sp.]